MLDYKLTKQAFTKLTELSLDNPKIAKNIKEVIVNLRSELISGESLTGYSKFKKIRTGKYRLIYTVKDNVLLIAIIEKREIVYKVFEHLFKSSSSFDL